MTTQTQTQADRIERAVDYLDAIQYGTGYAYYAEETDTWYALTADEMAELCDYLDHDDPDIARDAYSHWCAGTQGEEIPDPIS